MRLKYVTLAGAFLLFFSQNTQAQQHVVKLNLTGLVFQNIGLGYEFAFSEKASGALMFKYLPERNLPFTNLFTGTYEGVDYESPFETMRFSGFGFLPEFRFYPMEQHTAPAGLYLGMFLKYSSYKVTSSVTGEFTDPQGNSVIETVDLVGEFKPLGGGIEIGYQWLINDRISIDWTFIGLGFGVARASITLSNDNVVTSDIEEVANDVSTNTEYIGAPILDVGDQSVTLSVVTGWPSVRGGITFGVAF